jgi:hypothetical protein
MLDIVDKGKEELWLSRLVPNSLSDGCSFNFPKRPVLTEGAVRVRGPTEALLFVEKRPERRGRKTGTQPKITPRAGSKKLSKATGTVVPVKFNWSFDTRKWIRKALTIQTLRGKKKKEN